MTDYTHYERFMTRDELALRLNMETALRECCESECAKLKKELEVLEEKIFTLNDKYRELEKEKANVEIEAKLKLDSNLTILKGANANASALSLENEKLKRQIEEQQLKDWKEEGDRKKEEIKKLKEKDEEIERLREKVTNQKTQLNGVQQALGNRNIKIEALNCEVDRLKKEVKERRVVFEPTSYLIDIQTKDEEIKALRKKNLDLKNENEGLKVKYDHLAEVRDARIREINSLEEQIKDLQDTNRRQSDDIVALHKRNKLLNDEVNKLENDYYGVLNIYFGVLNKYSDLNKDYHELKKQKEDLNADIAKKVLDNIELNEQIEKDIQDYNKLFHEKEKLEKDLEDANKRATPPTQPLYIENLNVTYYANGPIWTNDNDSDEEETANILVPKGEE